MSRRLFKLVVPESKIDRFTAFSKALVKPCIQDYAKPDGIKFFQATNSPLVFFLVVEWKSGESASEFDATSAASQLYLGVQEYLAERLAWWDLDLEVSYETESPLVLGPDMYTRLTKLSVRPNNDEALVNSFKHFSSTITMKHPGVLGVRLFKCPTVSDVYFILSVWSEKNDFHHFRKSQGYKKIWDAASNILESRLIDWDINSVFSRDDVYEIKSRVIID